MSDPNDAVSLGRLVNEISRNMAYFIGTKLAPYELGKTDFDLLSLLSSRESIEQRELIDLMKSEKYTVTKAVKRLQQRGLVVKHRDQQDRRRLHITLTGEGKRLLPVMDELKGEITATLSRNVEFEQAAEILQRMAENMRHRVDELKSHE